MDWGGDTIVEQGGLFWDLAIRIVMLREPVFAPFLSKRLAEECLRLRVTGVARCSATSGAPA